MSPVDCAFGPDMLERAPGCQNGLNPKPEWERPPIMVDGKFAEELRFKEEVLARFGLLEPNIGAYG